MCGKDGLWPKHNPTLTSFRCTAEVTNLRQERVNLQEDISRQRQLEEKKLNLDREVEDLEKAVEELRDEKRPFEVGIVGLGTR